jgi:hypothetical protein
MKRKEKKEKMRAKVTTAIKQKAIRFCAVDLTDSSSREIRQPRPKSKAHPFLGG